jgi:hypothetical protein
VREDGTASVRRGRILARERLVGWRWVGLDVTGMWTGEESVAVEIGWNGVARGYRSGDKAA